MQFFGADDEVVDAVVAVGMGAPQHAAGEGGGGDDEAAAVFLDELVEFFSFEGRGVGHHGEAEDGRQEGADGQAEAVEDGQAAQEGAAVGQVHFAEHLGDVGDDHAVGEADALGLAGGAGGEEEGGFIAVFAGVELEGHGDEGHGGGFGEEDPCGDFGHADTAEGAVEVNDLVVGRPGELRQLAHEGMRGDEVADAALAHDAAEGVFGGGVVDVDGDDAGEQAGVVGDHAALAGGQKDAEARLADGFAQVARQGHGDAEDFVIGDARVVHAVDELDVRVGADTLDEEAGEGFLQDGVLVVGLRGGEEPGFEGAVAGEGTGGELGADDDAGEVVVGGVAGEGAHGAVAVVADEDGGGGDVQGRQLHHEGHGDVGDAAEDAHGASGDEEDAVALAHEAEEFFAQVAHVAPAEVEAEHAPIAAADVSHDALVGQQDFFDHEGEFVRAAELLVEFGEGGLVDAVGEVEFGSGGDVFTAGDA